MKTQIMLGIKDVFKHKIVYFLITVLILFITIILVSTTLSMRNSLKDNQYDNDLASSYEFVPISNDMSDNKELVNVLYSEIRKHSMTYLMVDELNSIEIPTIVVFGKGELFTDELLGVKKTSTFLVNSDFNKNNILINEEEVEIKRFDDEIISLPTSISFLENEEYMIIYVVGDRIDSWFDYNVGSLIITMLNNTSNNTLVTSAIEKSLDGSFLKMVSRISNDFEVSFVLQYMYPYIIFTFITIIAAFVTMNKFILKKMSREYVIHRLFGASITDIIVRNSVMIFLSCIVDILLYRMIISRENDPIVFIGYILIIVLHILFVTIMIHQIKNNHFMESIRGGQDYDR